MKTSINIPKEIFQKIDIYREKEIPPLNRTQMILKMILVFLQEHPLESLLQEEPPISINKESKKSTYKEQKDLLGNKIEINEF